MCTRPYKLTITRKNGDKEDIMVTCGNCPTCIKRRARDWTIKLINEAKYHTEASFITLTFSNEILSNPNSNAVKKYGAKPNFPYNVAYSKKYFSKFMKRLRKKFPDKIISYYHIGEYGERTKRAHHHVLLFGCDFREDAKEAELSKSGKPMLFSQTLEDLWAAGRTRIQLVNDNNIAYIAGYSTKKMPITEIPDTWSEADAEAASKNGIKSKSETFEIIYKKRLKAAKMYKPIQSFSNRSKMSVKWYRKRPYIIAEQKFLTDNDGKKYAFPKSYIREALKDYEHLINEEPLKITNPVFIEAYEQYVDRRDDFIISTDKKEQQRREQAQEKIYFSQKRNKYRDF